MIKPVKKQMAGWGNFPKHTGFVYQPETVQDIQAILDDNDSSQIAYGLGRSYGDNALNENNGMLVLDHLNHMLAFDADTGLLTCEAGVSLSEIIDVFLPRGFFPPVTPGTKLVTVGGAIANDVHGKNHHTDGTFSEFVSSFDLLLASGQVMTCSRDENADVFWATVGGIGLTGIIVRATIQLMRVETSQIKATYEKADNLDEAFNRFQENDANYKYSVAWIDCLSTGDALGRSVLMRGDHAERSDLDKGVRDPLALPKKPGLKVPMNAPSFALNYWSISAFNQLYYKSYKNESKLVDLTSFFHPLDAIGDWNKLYGKNGFVQYQAVFPKDNAPKEGIRQLLQKLSSEKRSSFLAVLKSSGKANDGLLSFPMEGYTLALDIPIKRGLFSFLKELDDIVVSFGGRVYLAKDSTLDIETFHKMYPNWEEFMAVKQRLDPEGRFSSSMSRRLGLG
ncbi:FAD/FMN-containing dehydrogenase [Lentibacillus persicus]|uniref:FAD/FMN-containing dehydrogenase n=1 Tax=Lentibacillus persicus TaxID=640948 RepID=A0A1I1VTR4_9BACI|nr:FAD-binding oxidoreductase [Lentibacillus persicus]SFD86426.1 FAD/FMN-containing dehydrogenase [Lentibacillus persicus]